MPPYLTLLLIFIAFILFVISVLYFMTRYKRVLLGICSLFVIIGFLIYTACYLPLGEGFAHALFATLRGIFSTARMFFMNDDYAVLLSIQGANG